MNSEIKITNNSKTPIVIDIEGIIGVLEETQFAEPENAVATYEKFKAIVTKIKEIDAKEIVVNIRSAGGDVNDAILIYEALKQLPAKITTRCYGYVASAATIIAQAASENRREISSSALYLIHNSIGNVEGNSDEMKQILNLLKITDNTIAEIYAQRAGEDIERFKTLMDENGGKGRWISPQEALDYKLVDKIVKVKSKVSNSSDIVEVLGLPPIPKTKHDGSNSIMKKLNRKWREITQIISVANGAKKERNEGAQIENSIIVPKSIEELAAVEISAKIRDSTKTETTPKEDPLIDDIDLAINENAYNMDVQQFR